MLPVTPQFSVPALLGNRHVQSMMTQMPLRRRRIHAAARRLVGAAEEVILDCGDGVRLQGFLSEGVKPDRGLVILLHGWEGSAGSSYVLSSGSSLLDAGFSVFRLNLRDHGDTKLLNEGLFHSCRIDEVVGAVRRVQEITNAKRLAVVGQSLGGNFALRVAVRANAAGIELARVIAVCPVLKPVNTMHALDTGLWVYRHYFLARWRRSLEEKARAFPGLYRFGDLKRFRSLSDTTRFFVENYTEFESLEAYLSGYAVTGEALAEINVPARIILALDDPVIPSGDIEDVAKPDRLELTLVDRGGHCGFVDSALGPAWVDREIVADLLEVF
jgi:predicted alpha/beta-fold hydrolase